jgi:hypothetical protein
MPADEILHAFESGLDGAAGMDEQIARRALDTFAMLITARTVYRSPQVSARERRSWRLPTSSTRG